MSSKWINEEEEKEDSILSSFVWVLLDFTSFT